MPRLTDLTSVAQLEKILSGRDGKLTVRRIVIICEEL